MLSNAALGCAVSHVHVQQPQNRAARALLKNGSCLKQLAGFLASSLPSNWDLKTSRKHWVGVWREPVVATEALQGAVPTGEVWRGRVEQEGVRPG